MKLAVLGCGRMGSAMIRGILASGITRPEDVAVSCSSPQSTQRAAEALGVPAASSNAGAVASADVVFLSVKPAQAQEAVSGVAGELPGKLLLSMVAGIRSEALHKAAQGGARIVRSMPNTAVRLRKGVTAIARGVGADIADIDLARKVFSSVGSVIEVREEDLDTVTAVSGSGPAFALLMLEALAQGGIDGGLDPAVARSFASGALAAAAALVLETGDSPLSLRAEITSPGGTTAAGLSALEEAHFPQAVRSAVRAARQRAAELSVPER
jgi:pyrroline-5-carboxylate reductase